MSLLLTVCGSERAGFSCTINYVTAFCTTVVISLFVERKKRAWWQWFLAQNAPLGLLCIEQRLVWIVLSTCPTYLFTHPDLWAHCLCWNLQLVLIDSLNKSCQMHPFYVVITYSTNVENNPASWLSIQLPFVKSCITFKQILKSQSSFLIAGIDRIPLS